MPISEPARTIYDPASVVSAGNRVRFQLRENSVNLTATGASGIINSGAIVANGNLGGANAGALALRTTNPEADITR